MPCKTSVHLQGSRRFFLVQDFEFPNWKVAELKSADTDPHELQDGMADRFEHAAHLTFLSLGDRQSEPCVLIRCANFTNDGWTAGLAAANVEAESKLKVLVQFHNACHFSIIGLRDFRFGLQQSF